MSRIFKLVGVGIEVGVVPLLDWNLDRRREEEVMAFHSHSHFIP